MGRWDRKVRRTGKKGSRWEGKMGKGDGKNGEKGMRAEKMRREVGSQ